VVDLGRPEGEEGTRLGAAWKTLPGTQQARLSLHCGSLRLRKYGFISVGYSDLANVWRTVPARCPRANVAFSLLVGPDVELRLVQKGLKTCEDRIWELTWAVDGRLLERVS
jgi:hypothetical protein